MFNSIHTLAVIFEVFCVTESRGYGFALHPASSPGVNAHLRSGQAQVQGIPNTLGPKLN